MYKRLICIESVSGHSCPISCFKRVYFCSIGTFFGCSTTSGHCIISVQLQIVWNQSLKSIVLLHCTLVLSLQVPQHYKLMGYQPVSVWDALHSYITPHLARPLQTAPPVTKLLMHHNRL